MSRKRYEDMTPEERIREASKNCPECGLPPDLCTCRRKEDKITLGRTLRGAREKEMGQKCGRCGYPYSPLSWTIEDGKLKCPKCGVLHKVVPI